MSAATNTFTTRPTDEPLFDEELVAAYCDPWLVRDLSGFRVELHWDVPETATVIVTTTDTKVVLDTFDVPVADALDAFVHTSSYSEALTKALT